MPKRLTAEEKDARAKAAIAKKEAAAAKKELAKEVAAKKKKDAHRARIMKKLAQLERFRADDLKKLTGRKPLTENERIVYPGRIRALSMRIDETLEELKKLD